MLLLITTSLAAAQGPFSALACDPYAKDPVDDWPDATSSAPAAPVEALDALLFPGTDRSDKERRGTRTDGVVVVHDGAVIYERYGGGYTADTRHLAWSATKSFTNALAGVAVHQGLLDLDASICPTVPVADEAACAVTVRHLLEFSSGFDWRETYEGESPTTSSVLAMLYGEGQADMAAFTAGHPLRDPPGTSWMYSSGDTNVLAAVVGSVLAPKHGERFPFTVLLDRIDMTSATWERDRAGTYVGSSYLYATPRDLARFGLLLLHDGCWRGERLLPEGWVEASTQVSEAMRIKALARDDGDVQGRQFWLNRPVPEAGQAERPWPDAPEDAFAAKGHWKQSVTVIPSEDLVVVRTADDRDGTFDYSAMLGLAIELAGAMP